MTTTRIPKSAPVLRLAPATLGALASLAACVHQEDLSDPSALMSASGESSGGSSTGGDGSSISATSTTGESACSGNAGAETSVTIATPPAGAVTSGIEDVAIAGSGEVSIAFIQSTPPWVSIAADGTATWGPPPGTFAHVGYHAAAASGRRLVALDYFVGGTDWLQMVEADGQVAWTAAQFDNGGPFNTLVDDVVALSDGTSLTHMYWVDDAQFSRLLHLDADGAELDEYEIEAPVLGGIVELPSGDVWTARTSDSGTLLSRFAAGSFAAPAQEHTIAGTWGFRLVAKSDGRLVILGRDPTNDQNAFVTFVEPSDGSTVYSFSVDSEPSLGYVGDVATGACGEVFVVGLGLSGHGGVVSIDETGVLWSDELEVEGAMVAGVADDGTLVVVGQTSYEGDSGLGLAPYVARYEP